MLKKLLYIYTVYISKSTITAWKENVKRVCGKRKTRFLRFPNARLFYFLSAEIDAQLKACQIDEQKCLSIFVCFNASLSFMPRIPKKNDILALLYSTERTGQPSRSFAERVGRLYFLKGKQKDKGVVVPNWVFFFFFWFDKINQNIFAVLIVGWFWLLLYCYFLEALSLSLSFSLGSVLDF